MDLSDNELSDIADELGVPLSELQSEAVKECAESVLDDPDNDVTEKSRAFAICQDMENEGRLAEAPNTHVTLAELADPGAIERVEEDGQVRYKSVLLLAPGVWGDAGSGRHVLYSPEGIENSADNWEDNTVNLFHERENEVTDVGTVDTDSIFLGEDDGGLYGDIVLHMDNPASEFADEALQNSLETEGREGLQGPSVELRGEEYDTTQHPPELLEGTFNGLGLVGLGVSPGPGSKDAAFAEQTRERAVALSGSDGADVLTLQEKHVTMEIETLRERLADNDIQLGEDADEDELRRLADAFDIELQEDEDDEEEEEEDEEESDEESESESEDEEEDEEEEEIDLSDVADQVAQNANQIGELNERVEAIAEATETLQSDDFDLAELAESVSDLSESVEGRGERVDDLETQLSELKETLEEPTSLASGGDDEPSEEGEGIVLQSWGTTPTSEGAFAPRR